MKQVEDTSAVDCLWTPSESFEETNIGKFAKFVESRIGKKFSNYWELHKWSVTELSRFWQLLAEHCSVVFSEQPVRIVDETKNPSDVPEWFAGAKLNFAENLIGWQPAERIALLSCNEASPKPRPITFGQLRDTAARMQSCLLAAGVKAGDRVAGYVPNCTESIACFAACAGIGAVWTCAAPDFGAKGVVERFAQVKPVALLSVDCVRYSGKVHPHWKKLHSVVEALPSLRLVLVQHYHELEVADDATISCMRQLQSDARFRWLGEALKEQQEQLQLQYAQLAFSQPLYILYSSGTTGAPKCIVHSAGGALLKHLCEQRLHANLGQQDVLLYFTSTGWMMWNWTVSALASGAQLLVYDGSPVQPSLEAIWQLMADTGVTVLGTSAKWLALLQTQNFAPPHLPKLRCILSTGSPLSASTSRYVYSHVHRDALLGSITGGTDIVGCFAGSNPSLPMYAGQIQSAMLGMAVQCWSESGCAVTDASGELVCTRPFPSQPLHFWGDADNKKYQASYFSRFPGVWTHGDFCSISSSTGGVVMLGRSDGTLNPSGVRFGSAEIYRVLEAFPEVADSLCVGQTCFSTGDERVLLFLQLHSGHSLTEDLLKRVRTAVRTQLSPRHVPAVIQQAQHIPYTFSGKKVELAVRQLLQAQPVLNANSIANQEALAEFAAMKDLIEYAVAQ